MGRLEQLAHRLDELERDQAELKSALADAEQARDSYHELYLSMMARRSGAR